MFYNDDDVDVGVDDDDDDDDVDVDADDCLFRVRHDLPEEKPVIGCNAPHDEYPLSDYDFHRHIYADDDVDNGDNDGDDVDDDVCQSNIYRECVSSLPRRRHQTACGYTLARRQEHHQHHQHHHHYHHQHHQHHHHYKHQRNQLTTICIDN